jgi:DMSO/TMAO reductase YedYZ molybdopterin-dependent catalytic subunit
LIVRSAQPEDLETPVHLLTTWITPKDLFYIRTHFLTPTIDEREWKLMIDGDVETPLTLTLQEIKALAATSSIVTLECAGNGRAFFQPPVAGVQWQKGAVGNAEWRGVRLADLLRKAGLKPSARYVWFDGGDRGLGKAPDFIRNLPVEKAMDGDTLLAYEMNGDPLTVQHGFPLRVIVPGWEGAYSVKWLTHVQVSDRQHSGAFVQSGYRYPRRRVQPGAVVAAEDTVELKELPVKSVITAPEADASVSGPIRIAGFTWCGGAEIARVDVSTDGGERWMAARLGANRAKHAWRQFEYVWQPREAGSYVLLSRATDVRGRAQPIVPDWNPGGYLWNAVDQVRVNVGTV